MLQAWVLTICWDQGSKCSFPPPNVCKLCMLPTFSISLSSACWNSCMAFISLALSRSILNCFQLSLEKVVIKVVIHPWGVAFFRNSLSEVHHAQPAET